MGRNLLYSHELTSTQSILKDNFRDYQSGLLCVADKQTAGRGRSSNKWDSPTRRTSRSRTTCRSFSTS